MEFKELKTKSDAEIKQLLHELTSKVHDMSVKMKLKQVKNTNELRGLKKDIARVLTYMRQQVISK